MILRGAALALVLAALLAPAPAPAQPPADSLALAPAPAPAAADSLALAPRPMAPVNAVPSFWLTRAERTGYRLSGTYDETAQYLRRLETASTFIRVLTYGRSGQGRDLLLVVAARDRAFTPEAARASGKPVVLVQCGIHAGEIEGKDAMLALLRDIAVTGRQQGLLDRCILLVVPMFSPDAHERRSRYNRINQNGPEEMGWRTTPTGLNLNRDYLKAEAPEMRAFLSQVYTRWWPDLLLDTHTTDGVDCRYDVTYAFNHGPEDPAEVTRWLATAFEGRVVPALEGLGHLVAPYLYLRDWTNPFAGFYSGDEEPRFSIGYPPLQCRPAVLVETHMLKPYEGRVRATYDLVAAALAEVGARPGELTGAVAAAEAGVIARGREPDPARRQVVLDVTATSDSVMFPFRGLRATWEPSDIAGAPVIRYGSAPLDTLIPRFMDLVPAVTVTQPVGYLVPQEWTPVVERLDLHGVRYRRFARAWSDTVEQTRVVDWQAAAESREGHHALAVGTVAAVRRWRTWHPGDLWVALDQRSALVAVHLLEARGPDALLRWNFFDTVLEKKEFGEAYVVEPLARRMMQEDPALAREFRARVAADSAFAGSPRARLEFFYRRSPWADPEQDLVPVARALRAPPEDVLAK
jgi:murein tripeptide amidase MpaA